MTQSSTRRGFLAGLSSTALGVGSLGDFSASFAADRRRWRVTYDGEVEPLVRLIEDTERERCVEMVGEQLLRGLSYRNFMSAVFLAGLRNGGDAGYYHCIYVIHAANQLAASTPVGEQTLPLFGALDLFKGWQARRTTEPGHFGMQPLPKKLLSTENALQHFHAAARNSDPDGVEAATIALSETAGRHELFRLLAMQALLGGAVHRSILVSNCWRVLEAMNWNHYLPTIRAMARILAADDGLREEWYIPLRKAAQTEYGSLPRGWARAEADTSYTRDLLEIMRSGDSQAAVESAVDVLFTRRVPAGALWDAAHLAAAESLVRDGDGNALHENTTLNALHYAFRMIARDDDRLMILLAVIRQAALAYGRNREASKKTSILKLTTTDISPDAEGTVKNIFTSTVEDGAVQMAFTLAQSEQGGLALARGLREVVVAKARNDAHPYKIAAAIIEDCQHVSRQWRPYVAAAPTALQRGGDIDVTDNPDSVVVLQAREILKRSKSR